MHKKLNDPKAAVGKVEDKAGKSILDLQSPQVLLDVLKRADQFSEAHGLHSEPNEIEAEIVLYSKGMTIDEAIYREYASPEGEKALQDVLQGRVPQDLLMKTKAQPASLILCDRRGEEYVPERFASAGQGVIGKVDLSVDFKCDESQPTTTLQIRFHTDKDLKKIKVNMNTKVADLNDYIMRCAPVNEEYTLLCGHPPQPLEDQNVTIEDLHLPNGTVIQQLIG